MQPPKVVTAKQIVLSILLDLTSHSRGDGSFTIDEILDQVDGGLFGEAYLSRTLSFLISSELVENVGLNDVALYCLTEAGFGVAEKLPVRSIVRLEAYGADKSLAAVTSPSEEIDGATIIKLPKTSRFYLEIGMGLTTLRDQIRGVNDDDGAVPRLEKDALIRRMDEAISIWEAAEFSVLQFRVGVLMAIEDAQNFLGRSVRSLGNKLLTDLAVEFIKSLIK